MADLFNVGDLVECSAKWVFEADDTIHVLQPGDVGAVATVSPHGMSVRGCTTQTCGSGKTPRPSSRS
jgi:hypothetical protein